MELNFKRLVFALSLAFALPIIHIGAAENRGGQVVVVFNSAMPESKDVATHYAAKRLVPPANLIGLDLPTGETMTREQYEEKLQQPLLAELEKRGLMKFEGRKQASGFNTAIESKVRYAALCYGVPVRIAPASRKESAAEKLPQELQRTEAAVDSELSLLPLNRGETMITGPFRNNLFAQGGEPARLHPTNGVLMVTRLDGPSPELAKGLVDKALIAEEEGLWGRAYIDARGLTNGNYVLGDEWIRNAGQASARFGFDTFLDNNPNTFDPAMPLSHIAVYVGWYDGEVSGPFAAEKVDFVPGAIAFHLHSFSAATVRTANSKWVGPLVHRGATVTLGNVYEPYLATSINIGFFIGQMLLGNYTFGEAAYASQEYLSWQTTAIGDPLYHPMNKPFQQQFEAMAAKKSPLMEWAHIRILNINKVNDPLTFQNYINEKPETRDSPILQEKLGDLYHANASLLEAVGPYERALKHATNPVQKLRLRLTLGRLLTMHGRDRQALDTYEALLKEAPNFPDKGSVYTKLQELATALDRKEDAAKYAAEAAKHKK